MANFVVFLFFLVLSSFFSLFLFSFWFSFLFLSFSLAGDFHVFSFPRFLLFCFVPFSLFCSCFTIRILRLCICLGVGFCLLSLFLCLFPTHIRHLFCNLCILLLLCFPGCIIFFFFKVFSFCARGSFGCHSLGCCSCLLSISVLLFPSSLVCVVARFVSVLFALVFRFSSLSHLFLRVYLIVWPF